jgi:hypothetical protein
VRLGKELRILLLGRGRDKPIIKEITYYMVLGAWKSEVAEADTCEKTNNTPEAKEIVVGSAKEEQSIKIDESYLRKKTTS